MTDKKMSGGFGSSLTALESLSGDCTEHTVLFIALARAAGIPARICSGGHLCKRCVLLPFLARGLCRQLGTDGSDVRTNHRRCDAYSTWRKGTVESDNLMEFAEGVFRTLNQLEIAIVKVTLCSVALRGVLQFRVRSGRLRGYKKRGWKYPRRNPQKSTETPYQIPLSIRRNTQAKHPKQYAEIPFLLGAFLVSKNTAIKNTALNL